MKRCCAVTREMRFHGGRPPPNVIDFSAPLNPLGVPEFVEELLRGYSRREVIERYPDYEYRELREAIASFFGIDSEKIVPLNGAAEALYLAFLAIKPRSFLAVEPTFGDHEVLCRAVEVPMFSIPYTLDPVNFRVSLSVELVLDLVEKLEKPVLVLLSNPNNPTGCLVPRKALEKLLEELPDDAYLLLDEAFVDFVEEGSSLLGYDNPKLVVVRSFTKILSIPGLRIGFAYVASAMLAKRFDSVRQPWNVNSIAASLMKSILVEYRSEYLSFIERSRRTVEKLRGIYVVKLRSIGLEIYDSYAPYILARHPWATHPELQRRLVENRVFVRDCSSFRYLGPCYSRIAIKNLEYLEILVEAFAKAMGLG